jgi:threonine/homoserine/homoserine lactone efflux protein
MKRLQSIPYLLIYWALGVGYGCQQLFNGLISKTKDKFSKILSISFGILFIIFAVFVVIPTYYFK